MFITNILCKKVKSKFIMVMMESAVSGHKLNKVRPRLGDKLEFMRHDPFIGRMSYYTEKKKVKSIK